MKAAVNSGKARAVGVCNYDVRQLEELHALLDKEGIPIACNQVLASLPQSICKPWWALIWNLPHTILPSPQSRADAR